MRLARLALWVVYTVASADCVIVESVTYAQRALCLLSFAAGVILFTVDLVRYLDEE
jgi:hypothetical protein